MPRHSRRSATRPWSMASGDARSRPTRRRAGAPVAASLGALALVMFAPFTSSRAQFPELVPITEVGQPTKATPAPPPTSAPVPSVRPVIDPGPDDVRLVRRTLRPARPETLTGYVWPLLHGRLTLPFGDTPWGSRLVEGKHFHDGIDLATFCGDRIVAAHAGLVLAASRRFDGWMGWQGSLDAYTHRLNVKHLWRTLPIVVIVDDGNGYRSIYAHFERLAVRAGEHVKAGQLLGFEGATGRASGCHLHYGLFSPLERITFRIDAEVARRMRLPSLQTARIDPLRVLPPRREPGAKTH